MTIPDEVVREMMRVYWDKLTHWGNDGAMRAAADVAVKWAREDQKEKDVGLLNAMGVHHKENYCLGGNASSFFEARDVIRNQKD